MSRAPAIAALLLTLGLPSCDGLIGLADPSVAQDGAAPETPDVGEAVDASHPVEDAVSADEADEEVVDAVAPETEASHDAGTEMVDSTLQGDSDSAVAMDAMNATAIILF